MARWNRVSDRPNIWEHPNGECEELHHHRPVLLLIQGVYEPNLSCTCRQCVVQEHKGYLWCENPSYTLCLQWQCCLHQHNTLWCWAFAIWRGIARWPFLLECLWNTRDHDYTPNWLLKRRWTWDCGRALLIWMQLTTYITLEYCGLVANVEGIWII